MQPFPKGVYGSDVLAGAKSPREIAVKAKEHPHEAATLFEQGAVKAWYASNGWAYPVEGTHGTGKGAVQQFFEALGLTKPPKLKIDSKSLSLQAPIGAQLTSRLTISTDEAKPVYAQAWSNRDWLKVGPPKYRGNMVQIPLEIAVPPFPDQTIEGQVTVRGNGHQQFVVPVSLTVEDRVVSEPSSSGSGGLPWLWIGYFAGAFLGTILLLVIVALALRRFL